jgi:hypothetical protein
MFNSSIITPFVQPNPDCTVYSPPPPYFPGFSASYCEYECRVSKSLKINAYGMHMYTLKTSDYNIVANSHTLQFTTTHIK